MTGVKLTERIRYIHCPGDDNGDSHGVLVLAGAYGFPTKILEVNDQADFRFAFNSFRDIEARQAEMNEPTQQLAAV